MPLCIEHVFKFVFRTVLESAFFWKPKVGWLFDSCFYFSPPTVRIVYTRKEIPFEFVPVFNVLRTRFLEFFPKAFFYFGVKIFREYVIAVLLYFIRRGMVNREYFGPFRWEERSDSIQSRFLSQESCWRLHLGAILDQLLFLLRSLSLLHFGHIPVICWPDEPNTTTELAKSFHALAF